MKYVSLIVSLIIACNGAFAQNQDTANFRITNYRLVPGTHSWRGTDTYFDRTSWESAPYTEGHLRHYNGTYRQNFRLLAPEGYDPNYSPGYPLMLFLHGAGERGNCWDKGTGIECYYGTTSYNPNTQPIDATQTEINNLLNNDHNLLHGGQQFLSARNRAGTRLPDDPTMPARAFPGFVVVPQMLNGWSTTEIRDAIRIVRLLIKQYNIDENRVYVNGLSMGGRSVLNAMVEAEWLFSAAAAMSAVPSHNVFRTDAERLSNIPLWLFQGGQDPLPTPQYTQQTVEAFRNAGGEVRHTVYPNLGHGTWNTAWNEPDFFSWFLSKNKANIHVAYESPFVCSTNGTGARLSLSAGFPAYQWERDGVIIPGATSNIYIATEPGVYRARFSRVSASPAANEWNRWSDPVTILEQTPAAPVLSQTGSVVLRDLNGRNNAYLFGPEGAANYKWYKNGNSVSLPNSRNVTISSGDCTGPCANNGVYTLVTTSIDNCPSLPSNPKGVFFENQAPVNIAVPTNFTGELVGPTEVLLRWNDVSGLERHYEIWRRKSTDAPSNGWTMIALTDEDAILYRDQQLEANTTYWYKIRAVSLTGRSDYAPGNSKDNPLQNVVITTGIDNVPPTAPQSLQATFLATDIATKLNTIRISWQPSTDNSGLKEYQIRYAGNTITVPATQTSYDLGSLPLNREYSFTVVAVDQSDNISTPSNQASARTYIDGFFWEHSTGAFLDIRDVPENVWASPEYTGKSTNLTLEPRSQEDFFVFRFHGYINITTAGNYKFRVRSNDGVQMWLDGNLVLRRHGVVNDGQCATTNFTDGAPPVFLSAGPHAIELRYFQHVGDKCLSFQWQGPDAGSDQTRFYDVPDTRIRSYEGYTPPTVPDAPIDLVATATGMTQIDLTWSHSGDPLPEFEIHRSLAEAGPYTMVNRLAALAYSDTTLQPGTTYYYKVRAADDGGVSEFGNIASATTETDSEVPTAPSGLVLFAKTITTASIGWTASTDNTGVEGYEIWANNQLVSTTQNNYFLLTELQPFSEYSVYVVAYDANENKSAPSNTIEFITSEPLAYYSKATGNLNELETWGTNPDGSGDSPSTFAINGLFLNVANRTTTQVGGPLTLPGNASRIIVNSGVTLTAESAVNATVDLHDNATLILANSTVPQLGELPPASTVRYAEQVSVIRADTYGNLTLAGTASKTFPNGVTVVQGNLTVENSVGVRGAAGNGSIIEVGGHATFNGSRTVTSADVTVGLSFTGNGQRQLTAGQNIELFSISTSGSVQLALQSENESPLRLGSNTGGGLVLAANSSFDIGSHTLTLVGNARVNPSNESGVIISNNGSINLTSGSDQKSNLHFGEGSRLSRLGVTLTNSGTVVVQTPASVADGIKLIGGTLEVNNNVTLISTAEKTANLEQIENNGTVSGNLIVQRFIPAKAKTYRYLSSSVEGVSIAHLQQYFPVTGGFENSSIDPNMKSAPSIFVYQDPNWIPFPTTNNQATLQKGVGYSVYIKNDLNVELTTSGYAHQGSVQFNLISPADTENSVWNLVGNPYASTIQWSTNTQAWPGNGVSSIIAVRNNLNSTTGQFMYYDASTGLGTGTGGILPGGRIAPGQAFYVLATAPNASLSVTEAAKSVEQQTIYREEATSSMPHLRISIEKGGLHDEAIVVLTPFGSDAFDEAFDAVKHRNPGMFNIASNSSDGKTLAINNMRDSFCEREIPLSISDLSRGEYSLSVASIESMIGIGTIELMDAYTNTIIDLTKETTYAFSITTEAASLAKDRFSVRLKRPSLRTDITNATSIICGEGAEVTLNDTQAGATYSLRAGETTISEAIALNDRLTIRIPKDKLSGGANTLEVYAQFKGCAGSALSQSVAFEYIEPGVPMVTDLSVCKGSNAVLEASASNATSFAWYNENGTRIKGETGSSVSTDEILNETTFYVAGVAGSCESATASINVTPVELIEPGLIFQNDTLYTNVSAELYTWTFDGREIKSTHVPYIVPSISGNYAVSVRTGQCIQTSSTEEVQTLTESSELRVYPNPVQNKVIRFSFGTFNQDRVNAVVVDPTGRVMHREEISLKKGNIIELQPANPLAPGVYLLILNQGSQASKTRFVVPE